MSGPRNSVEPNVAHLPTALDANHNDNADRRSRVDSVTDTAAILEITELAKNPRQCYASMSLENKYRASRRGGRAH